ncbi:1,4-dihydroxy-2-naphthoate octaprenyltransferase [Thalassobacillus devorans]|uniref:1,4-dihydroxy-2-naphthoate octaprenyltransferase n=1 Tax=Thalassobacillus devorans TaxID=279813 RepID=UPI000A1CF140|nr:1,4-dihydroxy-2-naphthoate octaprenyltransferase [Thalassobacillus devorans]
MQAYKKETGITLYICKLSWVQLMRPMTWSGTISPIMAGALMAAKGGEFRWEVLVILLAAALLVQSGANMFNDYFDFKRGQDKERWGVWQKSIPRKHLFHHEIPYMAAGLMASAAFLGVWLAVIAGWWVIVVGLIGICTGIGYSAGRRSLASLGLGEVTAGLFLGFVTTMLSYGVQTQMISIASVFVGLVFSMLISSMVLTNNIRDIKKDTGFRKTLAMRIGRRNAIRLLAVLLIGAYLVVMALRIFSIVGSGVLLVSIAFPLVIRILRSFRMSGREEQLAMKRAAIHHWVFGMLFVLGLLMDLM